jgi:hypothetical protein
MFRRITRLAAIPLIAAAGLYGAAGVAWADASTPGHFSYIDNLDGPVTCNEVHHPATHLPGTSTYTKGYDTVQCKLAMPSHAGQTLTSGWASDFGTRFDQHLGTITLTYAGDGLSYHGVASYPNG